MSHADDVGTMEWELSKENVLPKKNGRSVSQLVSALQPQGDHQIQLRALKHKFEEELRAYSGDDPLDVWYRYISWIEENYPKGGKKDLSSILTSCMKAFCEEEKYKNDARYVDIWIKFAILYDTPELMYEHMRDKGIGCQCAALYEAWASYLELLGNTKKADAIFAEGLRRKAEPFDVLQKRHQEFQNRTVLSMMKQSTIADDNPLRVTSGDLENRVAFTGLETKGKKKEVPSIRPGQMGLVKTDVRVPLSGKVQKPQKSSKFQIYSDENQPTGGAIFPDSGANEYQRLPVQSAVNRENSKIPGPWTKNKITQKKSFPVAQMAPFEVQRDGSSEIMTPKKAPEIDSQVLSVRKPEKDGSSQQHYSNPMPPVSEANSFQKTMYCKDKIYAGCEEYSFEELRALRWRRKEQEKAKQAIEEMNRRLMEEQQQILLKNRELMQQQKLMQEEMQQTEKEIAKNLHVLQSKYQEKSLELSQLQTLINTSENATGLSVNCSSRDANVEKNQAAGDAVNNSVNRSGFLTTSLNNSNMKTPEYSRNSSQSSSFQTGSNSSLHSKKVGKKSLSAPSPTVNTIEALQVVRGLYNASINLGKDSTIDDDQDNNPFDAFQEVPPKQTAAPVLSKAPFTICEDELQPIKQPPTSAVHDIQSNSMGAGFQVFCDEPASDALEPLILQENKMNVESQEIFRLPMPDMNEITLGFGLGNPQIQATTTSYSLDGANNPPISNDVTNISEQSLPVKKLTSTPFHFASNMYSQPDFANMSTISGTTCASTENTIMIEQPTAKQTWEMSNKTAGLSPIKEGSTEGTHSSLESRTLEPSQHSTHHATHHHSASVKSNMVTEPFSKTHQQKVLAYYAQSLEQLDNFHVMDQPVPSLSSNSEVSLGFWNGTIVKPIAKGGNGQIFKLAVDSTFAVDQGIRHVAVKVQKPACMWEFYICNEILQRSKSLPSPKDMSSCYMSVSDGFFYKDGSILIEQFYKYGTLLDLVNKQQADPGYGLMCESLAVYFLIELLTIVDHLHKCQIIHGDIKPDNIVLKSKNSSCTDLRTPKLLTLIDYGESIDMTTYPEGTVFSGKVLTSSFQCVEMRTDRPWTYQTDLFGVLGAIHVVLFGKYMKIFNNQGKWQATSNFQRKWNVPLWKQLFHDFLNIPSCDKIPNLLTIREQFINYFTSSLIPDFQKALHI